MLEGSVFVCIVVTIKFYLAILLFRNKLANPTFMLN